MAGDKEQRTEKPTSKRKKELREKGTHARSPEVAIWAGAIVAVAMLPFVIRTATAHLTDTFSQIQTVIVHPDIRKAMSIAGNAFLAVVWVVGPLAAAMLAGGGIGAACAEVAGRTLLQRIAGHERLGEAFSIVESTQMAALAVGTLTVGSAVQEFGPRGALVVPALVLLGVTAATARAVRRSERYATRSVVQFA